jgi:hypothetical protein
MIRADEHVDFCETRPRSLGRRVMKAEIRRSASPHMLVREALLHRSIASTLVYARVDGERLRRAMA